MRVGILTSTDIRHRYFANAVRRRCDVTAVGYQNTGYVPADAARESDAYTAKIVRMHFAERRRQEELFFGHDAGWLTGGAGCGVVELDAASLNTPGTVRFLQERRVDVVVVYGTSLVKPPLLDAFAGRMINLHLGLSPYYRGTATNFYPLVNEEPEYVGATVHLIDAGIDSGAIIHQARPEIAADDMPHTVGCKAILAGIDVMVRALDEWGRAAVQTVPQWPCKRSRLYLRRDYRPDHVVRLYRLIERGLFPRYVERRERAVRAVPIVA